MPYFIFNTRYTPAVFIYLLLMSTAILALNVTDLLSSFSDLSDFTNLLTSTGVAADLAGRSSLTILAVPNSYLRSSDVFRQSSSSSVANLADVVRYHILLEYLSWTDLKKMNGKLITTLYQTTGRASDNFGSVNITGDKSTGGVIISSPATYSPSNATIISLIETVPYNLSIFTINSTLVPFGFNLITSETRPSLGINITKALIEGHDFNVAAALLTASAVEKEFENDEGGAGITIFVPTDEAFSDLPISANFQSLPADEKAIVLKFHVLRSYYPLGSLESIVNPVQPTLATEIMGAGSFTLNISRVNGSIAINSGLVQALVTQTLVDQNPLAIFGVSNVLLPREVFGNKPVVSNPPGGGGGYESPANGEGPVVDEKSPEVDAPAPSISSSSYLRNGEDKLRSGMGERESILSLCCIGLYVLLWSLN
ncbi:fasciclin-like arabinogalactan protein 4 [Impatiens glandulifera]|uniref:fasciclin-like arabinogalactan protein 4 n=1 Tax=Impatiens glandulifera TaxID=253017 RepID=UPI001FB05AC2|nr:fasciclin-like arabinogalactan protein 4 [Impatiens glandulifera]